MMAMCLLSGVQFAYVLVASGEDVAVRKSDPSAFTATMSTVCGQQPAFRRNATRVPSGDQPGALSTSGPPTSNRLAPVSGLPTYRSPAESYTISPLRAGPNGGATLRCEPTTKSAARTSAINTRATAISRQGGAGANARVRAMSATGSHLSGNVQPGRCRMRPVRAKTSSRYSGAGPADRSSRMPGRLRS